MLLLLGAVGAARAAPLDEKRAWQDACALSGYFCGWFRPPLVIRAPMGFLNGRYIMGDSHVLVHEGLPEKLAYAVAVHEMVHYLQYKHKAWKSTPENRCVMEHDAFDVSNAVLRRLGETKYVVEWDSIKVYYGCAA